MPSPTYELIVQAMAERQQVLCSYDGFARELCPIILGHKNGEERTLAFQFAGASSKKLPPGGDWKCLELAKMSDVRLRTGRWYSGSRHTEAQHCVDEVDVDVNPDSPYDPRRRR
ncbi:hypothetical protein ACQR1W_00055 [Bradyrhizobium sp. HKCCYLS1011]|uniref:hypothetical protein n=1 Tax=Bradyrhizobium sp. HKCCYLS1011 TaxID=3420733 RepID=UPI003EBC1C5F